MFFGPFLKISSIDLLGGLLIVFQNFSSIGAEKNSYSIAGKGIKELARGRSIKSSAKR